MEIRDIAIDDVNIPDIQVYQPPGWTTNPSQYSLLHQSHKRLVCLLLTYLGA